MVTPMGSERGFAAERRRMSGADKLRLVTINIGPQHPSTHGVLRLKVVLEGEIVRDVDVIMGYLHRSTEKLFEDGSFLQAIPLTDRLDYVAAMHNNYALCHGVEELMRVEVPERAQYIRAAVMEIQRIASHLLALGTFGLDVGAMTPFFWCMRDREGAIRLMELASGARLTYTWYRIGGLKNDLPDGWTEEALRYVKYMRPRIDELDALLTGNDVFVARTKGVGLLSKEDALSFGCSGPMLRGSGVDWDLRRDEPWDAYRKLKVPVAVGKNGDCFDRYWVRLQEMRHSCDLVEQIIADMPETGDFVSPEVGSGARQHRVKPPAGEVYSRIEGARGEYGVYIVSDGSAKPYRLKWRPPSLGNLHPLAQMVRGQKIPDLIATLGSTDIVLGDLDR